MFAVAHAYANANTRTLTHKHTKQVLNRLRADGVFPWMDNDRDIMERGIKNLHVCFYMRRYVI